MLPGRYEFGGVFQLRILAFLVRHPEKAVEVIKPDYFENLLHYDIARVVCKAYKAHPKSVLTKATLKQLVKQSLSREERKNWSIYKREIRAVYRMRHTDDEIIFQQAVEFAREQKYRKALVRAEKAISDRHYDAVPELFETLRKEDLGTDSNSWRWKSLPRYGDFKFEEVEWLIDGIIPAGLICALSGNEGVGKTLLALEISRSLTEGRPFLGRQTQFSRVLYLGLDTSKVTLQSYIRAMRWIPSDDFRIMTMWTGEGYEAPMLDNAEGVQLLYKLAAKYRPVIIFDTLRDFFEGEENSSTDMKPILDVLRRLRSQGATVILLVHPPKDGSSIIRGTGNISQKVDLPYLLQKKHWQGKDIVVLTCPTKNRTGTTSFQLPMRHLFIPTPAGLRFVMTEVANWKASTEPKEDEAKAGVIKYVKAHPGTNQKQIEGELKMTDRRVRKALGDAKDDGTLRSVAGKRKEHLWYDAAPEDESL